MTLRFEIAIRIVVEHGDAIFDVVIHHINFTALRINFDSRNETDLGLWANNLPHRGCHRRRVAARRTVISQHAFAVLVAHEHTITVRIYDDAVERGVRIDHVANRRKLSNADGAGIALWSSQNIWPAIAPPCAHITRRISHQARKWTRGIGEDDRHSAPHKSKEAQAPSAEKRDQPQR